MFEVFKKELTELLRDKKTLLFVVVFPIVVFPLLFAVVRTSVMCGVLQLLCAFSGGDSKVGACLETAGRHDRHGAGRRGYAVKRRCPTTSTHRGTGTLAASSYGKSG